MSSQLDSLLAWKRRETGRFATQIPALTVAVGSGKGGVGKSHLSLALGMALAGLGHRTLLLDGDMGLANLHLLAGVNPEGDLGDVLAGQCGVRDILLSLGPQLDLLPASSGVAGFSGLPPERVSELVASLSGLQAEYRFAVVDTGAGIGETSLGLLEASDRVLLLTTPESTAQTDAYALLKILRARRSDLPFSLVLNQCESNEEGVEVASRLSLVARRFLGCELPLWGILPHQKGFDRFLRERTPVLAADPEGPFALAVRTLAERLTNEPWNNGSGRFFERLVTA